MPRVCKSFASPYTTSQMYSLVNDINSYKYFLPKCTNSNVIYETSEIMEAELVITALGVNYKFITRNKLIKNKSIAINLVEGPFKYLQGRWLFNAINNHYSQTKLELEFQLKNAFVQMTLHPILDIMVNSIFNSFKSRANNIFMGKHNE